MQQFVKRSWRYNPAELSRIHCSSVNLKQSSSPSDTCFMYIFFLIKVTARSLALLSVSDEFRIYVPFLVKAKTIYFSAIFPCAWLREQGKSGQSDEKDLIRTPLSIYCLLLIVNCFKIIQKSAAEIHCYFCHDCFVIIFASNK